MTVVIKSDESNMPGHFFVQMLHSDMFDSLTVSAMSRQVAQDGMYVSDLLAPGARAPFRWLMAAMPHMDAELAAWVGHRYGVLTRITSHDRLSIPLLCAPTLGDFLRTFRFFPLLTNTIRASLHEGDEALVVVFEACADHVLIDRIALYYCVSATISILRMVFGNVSGGVFYLVGGKPAFFDQFSLGDHVGFHFNAALNCFVVRKPLLSMPGFFSDKVAYGQAVRALESSLLAGSDSVVSSVGQIIAQHHGQPLLEGVAARLHVSPSTLKRRLAAAGVSFQRLVEDARRARAVFLLLESNMSLAEISEKLGYRDLSSFSHAFKRWTGVSPGSFRKKGW